MVEEVETLVREWFSMNAGFNRSTEIFFCDRLCRARKFCRRLRQREMVHRRDAVMASYGCQHVRRQICFALVWGNI